MTLSSYQKRKNKGIKLRKENQDYLDKFFWYGDYLGHQTASGEEESGIRLNFNLDQTLTKEETEFLYKIVRSGYATYQKQNPT